MKHEAPDVSEVHRDLLHATEQAGYDPADLRKMLWLINAPDTLVAFALVCQTLGRIFDLFEAALPDDLLAIGVPRWADISAWVVAERDVLASEVTEKLIATRGNDGGGKSRREINPMMRFGAKRHPLYTALCDAPENQDLYEPFLVLAGHFIIAHIRLTVKYVTQERYETYTGKAAISGPPSKPYAASLGLRAMSGPDAEPFLSAIDLELNHDEFLRSALKPIHRVAAGSIVTTSQHEILGKLEFLIKYMRKVAGLEPWNTRVGGTRKKSRKKKRRKLWLNERIADFDGAMAADINDPDDPYGDWGEMSQVLDLPSDQPAESDITPEELDGDDEVYLSHYGCQVDRQTAAQYAVAVKGQIRHIIMESQLHPWRYQSLTLAEIQLLSQRAFERFDDLASNPSWGDTQYLEAESLVLILIILWLGVDLARAVQLKVLREKYEKTSSPLALCLGTYNASGARHWVEWRIRSHFPEYATRPTMAAESKSVTPARTDYVWLPDMVGLTRVVVELEKRKAVKPRGRLFNGKIVAYNDKIKLLLKELPESDRVTIAKIQSALFYRVARTSGDIVDAVLITGTPHRLAEVKGYYTTRSQEALRWVYSETVAAMTDGVESIDVNQDCLINDSSRQFMRKHVGARYSPRLDAVAQAVGELRQALVEASDYASVSEFITYHNLYTSYVVMMFGHVTAYRAVRSPLLQTNEIDEETGFAVVADKETVDGYKSRLVWVPEMVRAQLKAYEAHLRALQSGHLHWITIADRHERVFYLDADGHFPIDVRPTSVLAQLKAFLPIPANSHRRLMRNELVSRGCNPEVVDTWMGHWSRGEEPWGEYSSFSYSAYAGELDAYLVPILEKLGFRVIRSPLGIYDE